MLAHLAFARRRLALPLFIFCLALLAAGCSGKSKTERLYEEGRLFYKNRKYFNAIDKYEEALQLQPDNAKVRSAAAEAYLKSSPPKPETAIEYAGLALQKDDSLDEARLTMGQAHLQLAIKPVAGSRGTSVSLDQSHLEEARRIAGELMQRKPESVEGRLLQARIEAINGNSDAAERLYREIVDSNPQNLTAKMGLIDLLITKENYVEAEVLAREAANDASEGSPNPAFRNQLALILLRQGRHDDAYQALAPYLTAENKSPDLGSFVIASQVLFDQLGKVGREVASVDPLVREETLSTDSQQNQTIQTIADRLGGIGTAMKTFYPTLPESFFIRGISYELQDDMQEAIRNYAQAVTLAPGEKKYRLALALGYLRVNDIVQARQELSTLLKAIPGDYEARLAMARSSAMEGATGDAVLQLRELHLEQPDDRRTIAMLSRLLLLSEKPEEVEEGLNMLVGSGAEGLTEQQEKMLRARSNMLAGMGLSREGRHAEATDKLMQSEQMLREVAHAEPTNVQAEALLSELAQRRGDLFEALAHARRASKLDPQYLPREASLYSRLGQYRAARNIYESLLLKQPNSVPFAVELVEVEAKDGNVEAAVQRMESLIEKNPKDMRLVLSKARLLTALKRQDEAIELLKTTHGQEPDQLGIAVQLARLYIARNQAQDAAELLLNAANKSSEQLTMMRAEGQSEPRIRQMMGLSANLYLELALTQLIVGQYAEAISNAQMAAQIDGSTAIQAAILEALGLFGQGQPGPAQSNLQKAEAQTGNKPASFPYLKALALAAAGDTSKAIDVIKADPGMNPDTRELFLGLLQKQSPETLKEVAAPLGLTIQFTTVVDKESYAESQIAMADRVLQKLPNDPFVLSRKAEALGQLGRHEESIPIFQQIHDALPEFLPALRQLSMAHDTLAEQTIAKGDRAAGEAYLKQAEAFARQALDKAPNSGPEVQRLGMILQGLGRTQEANELYRKTIQIDPKNWTSYNNLAWNLAQAGQFDEALQIAQNALQNAPAGGVARGGILDTLGWIELQKGDSASAVEHLREASLLAPNEPEIRLHYAQALEATGNRETAVAQLEAVIQATPGYARLGEAREILRRLEPDSPYLTTSGGADSATTGTAQSPAAGS